MVPVVINAGVDTLELSWDGDARRELFARLEDLRLASDRAKAAGHDLSHVQIAGRYFAVEPRVARWPYRFILSDIDGDVRLVVAPHERQKGVALVKAESAEALALWSDGVEAWVRLARECAADLMRLVDPPGELGEEYVSRLDLAVDLQGWHLTGHTDELEEFVRRASVKMRGAQEVEVHVNQHQRWTGWTFGRGPLLVRIYVKSLEIVVHGKAWFEDKWKQHPAFRPGEEVLRVELQLRRAVLKELGVKGWDPSQLDRLWAWAVGSPTSKARPWISYRRRSGDTNRSRWPVAEAWRAVQRAVFVEQADPALRERRYNDVVQFFETSIRGWLGSYAALLGLQADSAEHLWHLALAHLLKSGEAQAADWKEDVDRKRPRYASKRRKK